MRRRPQSTTIPVPLAPSGLEGLTARTVVPPRVIARHVTGATGGGISQGITAVLRGAARVAMATTTAVATVVVAERNQRNSFTHASILVQQGQRVGALLFLLCYIFIMKIVETRSLEETQKLAKEWLNSISIKDDEATIVGLYGNLGSGKTTFAQSIARELGIKETVTSPTFVIEKIYDTDHILFNRLIHIDAYRLESGRELQVLNFEQEVANENNLILVEWPENVKEILPENHIRVYFEFVDENTRKFSF